MSDDFTSGFLAGQNDNDGCGFGGGSWWIVLIIFALIFGWGGNGGFAGGGGVRNDYVLTSDFANIERKLDGVNNGICSLGYEQLAQMSGINSNIANLGMQMQSGFNAQNIANLQGQNALSTQLANCCCENKAALADIKYQLQADTCAITTALNDRLTAMEMSRKDERIAEQAQRISALELAASQSVQNSYLINQLRPAPVPAYCVPTPFYYGQQNSSCGCM